MRLRSARLRRNPGAALAMAMSPMAVPQVHDPPGVASAIAAAVASAVSSATSAGAEGGVVEIEVQALPPPPPPPDTAVPPKSVASSAAGGAHGWSGVTEPQPQLRYTARYAAGRLVPTRFVNSLIVASLRNPSLLRLVTMFARGEQLRLRHVQVPPELLSGGGSGGAFFATVYLHMALRHRVIVVGVFRDARGLGAPLPYVMTNPPMNSRIRTGDVLFVIVPVAHAHGAHNEAR